MSKVVIGRSQPGVHGVIIDVDFRLTNTTVKEPVPYSGAGESGSNDESFTDIGEKQHERVNGLNGVEYVTYRPFSFQLEVGWAFKIQDVVEGALDIIRGLCAEEPVAGEELDLHYMRSTGIVCPLRERDYDNAMRELQFA
jgi:hypothetical protein